jgi:chromosome segregation ATPase
MPVPPALLDWEPVKECFAELRAQQAGLDQYIEQSFEELDVLRANLEQFQCELRDQRAELLCERQALQIERDAAKSDEQRSDEVHQALEKQLAELRDELELVCAQRDEAASRVKESEQTRAQLDTAQSELAELRAQRDEVSAEAASVDEVRDALRAAVAGRDALDQQLSELRSTQSPASVPNEEFERLRAERADAQAELLDVLAQLEDAQRELREQQEYIQGLEEERGALDSELDTVRGRAAELNDTLVQTKQQMAAERAEWSGELKQMRQVLERHSHLAPNQNGGTPVAVGASAHRDTTPGGTATKQKNDPVLGSIVAQFERIRQERAQQRTQRQKDPA